MLVDILQIKTICSSIEPFHLIRHHCDQHSSCLFTKHVLYVWGMSWLAAGCANKATLFSALLLLSQSDLHRLLVTFVWFAFTLNQHHTHNLPDEADAELAKNRWMPPQSCQNTTSVMTPNCSSLAARAFSQFQVQFQWTGHINPVSLFRLFSGEKSPLNPAQCKVQCT